MIIIFNFIGAGILLLSFIVGTVVGHALGASNPGPEMLLTGILAVGLDILYRIKVGENSFFHPRRGGHICFLPVWIIGAGCLFAGVSATLNPNSTQVAASQNSRPTASGSSYHPSWSAAPASPAVSKPAAPATLPASASLARFTPPAQPAKSALKLGMISGTGQHRVATVNGEPFAEGESHKLTVGQEKRLVQCLEIRDQSIIAKIFGERETRELKVGQPVYLAGTQ